MSIFCPKCGNENIDTSLFCSNCGSALNEHVAATNTEKSTNTIVAPNYILDWIWGLFKFEGRINRQRYWLYFLLQLIMLIPLLILGKVSEVFAILEAVFMFWTMFALTIKRWHDLNQSGWWSIVGIIPFVNLILGFIQGTEGNNQYGPDIVNV